MLSEATRSGLLIVAHQSIYGLGRTVNEENIVGAVAWGLLRPETIASERRTRTLDLGAAVRTFNDLAIPGLGGVWFGKQLLLATLGVAPIAYAERRAHCPLKISAKRKLIIRCKKIGLGEN